MSSYVAVVGKPTAETCCIFGLTPQEVRYLQSKFPEHMKHDEGWNPKHGVRLECTCIVVLNALGYIGFKVISTSGDSSEYLWTMERNLDMDTHYQAPDYDRYVPSSVKYGVPSFSLCHSAATKHHSSDDGTKGCLAPPKQQQRRHSLTERIANALHL